MMQKKTFFYNTRGNWDRLSAEPSVICFKSLRISQTLWDSNSTSRNLPKERIMRAEMTPFLVVKKWKHCNHIIIRQQLTYGMPRKRSTMKPFSMMM